LGGHQQVLDGVAVSTRLPRTTADGSTEFVDVIDIASAARREGERRVDLECLLTQALYGQRPEDEAATVKAISSAAARLLDLAGAYLALCAERRETDRGAA